MNSYSAYYDLLGVSPDSDYYQIKRAFREKAKLYHPDVNHAPFAQAQFIKIREAFVMLIKEQQHKDSIQTNSSHISRAQKYQTGKHVYSPGNGMGGHRLKKEEFDFTGCMQGKIIYCTVHLVFLLIGFLIFLDPIIIAVKHQFDPFKPLYDSIFAAAVTMIFGMVMVWRIGISVISFMKKQD